jgi:hypothetical protein
MTGWGKRWRLSRHSLPAAVVFVLLAALAFFRRTDIDFWWHLRAGQLILETGQVPRVDPFSYTKAGEPWVAHEWLWEVIQALLMAGPGYVGLSVLLAVLLLAAFGMLYRLIRAEGVNEWVAAGLLAMGVVMSLKTLTARPHAVTYVFVAVTLWLLADWRRGRERRLWWLPVLLIPWVNIHGGYAIGLGLVGLTLAGELLDAGLARRRPRVGTLAGVLLAGAATASLNPQGPAIHLFALGFLNRDSAMQQYIQEWASPDFHEPVHQVFAAAILLLALVGLRPRARCWSAVLPVLAFTWLGLQGVRHIPLFALTALPAIAAGLAAWRPLAARERLPEPAPLAALNWLMVALIAGATAAAALSQPLAQIHREPLEEWYPTTALAYLQRERPPGPIFNFDGWGGYLIARAPEYPVYIDGRADLYGSEMEEEYRQVIHLKPGWREVLERRGVRLVLIQRETPLAAQLAREPGWRLLVEGEEEALFGRAP